MPVGRSAPLIGPHDLVLDRVSSTSPRSRSRTRGASFGVDAGPVEPPVHGALDPPPQRLEQRERDQRGRGDGEGVLSGDRCEHRLEDDDDADKDRNEDRRDDGPRDRPADDVVDGVQPVAQHRDRDRDRDAGQ